MAEAIGIVSGVVGISSFAIQLAQYVVKLNPFCGNVKQAPRRLLRLIEEIEIMGELMGLLPLEDTSDHDGATSTTGRVERVVRRCRMLYEDALRELASITAAFHASMERKKIRDSHHGSIEAE
jgi:hypothetical protein